MLLHFPKIITNKSRMGCLYFFNDKTKIMQKSVLQGHKIWSGAFQKTVLVMKLVIILILSTTLQPILKKQGLNG